MVRAIVMVMMMACGLCATPTDVAAQQIPPPTGPVVFCGVQAAPEADSYSVRVDGGEAQSIAFVAALPECPSGSTHSFALDASMFPIGSHTVQVIAANAFGATEGPQYAVVVGIAPGQFAITAVIPPGE